MSYDRMRTSMLVGFNVSLASATTCLSKKGEGIHIACAANRGGRGGGVALFLRDELVYRHFMGKKRQATNPPYFPAAIQSVADNCVPGKD